MSTKNIINCNFSEKTVAENFQINQNPTQSNPSSNTKYIDIQKTKSVKFSKEFIYQELSKIPHHITSACFFNLNAVVNNYKKIQSFTSKSCECAAVVKANSYGFGALQVSTVLYENGCRKFFVSSITEAMQIRKILKDDALIYVFNGLLPQNFDFFVQNNIIPVLTSKNQIYEFIKENQENQKNQYPAALHIDTGMMRNGLSISEAAQMSDLINENINLHFILSHLACADIPDHPINKVQLQNFQDVTDKFYPNVKKCLCNSNGAMLGQEYQFDIIRPGKTLYGFAVRKDYIGSFEPVLYWYAKITQINYIKAEQSVGYGATFFATSDMTLATIGIGYNDGFFRRFCGDASVVINGKLAKIVGRISMDYIVVDVTEIEGVEIGNWAVITDNEYTIETWADAMGTIPHEITCKIGERVARRWYYCDED